MDIDSPILILSDVHLGSKMARAKELLNFLKSADFGTLILNGDVLDNPNLHPGRHLCQAALHLLLI